MYVIAIQPGNKALEFIDKRIADVKYRGTVSSQHNRYDMDEVFNILKLLDQFAPKKSLMRIRDADLSRRPSNTPDEVTYAKYCEAVKRKVGKGTQDSIRKNIFVDIHRMGLIERYDDNKNQVDAYARSSIKYVSLTKEGKKFVNSDLLNRAYLFTKAIDSLLSGYIELSLELLKDRARGIKIITKYEFMFFVSAINTETTFNITMDECVELIGSYRLLSRIQQKAVVETLKQKLQPRLFTGDKTKKRDWHNWQNKIDQVYHLFKQSPYFDVSGADRDLLALSVRKVVTRSGKVVDLQRRSIAEKFAYFKEHRVNKTPGYDLHHVMPLSWSESAEHYKLFDKWQNMVYIDAYSHAKITQNRNRNVSMRADGNNLVLSDYNNNEVRLVKGRTVLYSPAKQSVMLDYNKQLLTTI